MTNHDLFYFGYKISVKRFSGIFLENIKTAGPNYIKNKYKYIKCIWGEGLDIVKGSRGGESLQPVKCWNTVGIKDEEKKKQQKKRERERERWIRATDSSSFLSKFLDLNYRFRRPTNVIPVKARQRERGISRDITHGPFYLWERRVMLFTCSSSPLQWALSTFARAHLPAQPVCMSTSIQFRPTRRLILPGVAFTSISFTKGTTETIVRLQCKRQIMRRHFRTSPPPHTL